MEDELEELESEENESETPESTIDDLKDDIEDVEDEISLAKGEIETHEDRIEDNEQEVEQKTEDKQTFEDDGEKKVEEMIDLSEEIIDGLEEISERIGKAKDLNKEIKDAIDDANNNADANYSDAEEKAEGPPSGVASEEVDDALQEIKENSAKLEDYPYEPSFFDEIKEPIYRAIDEMRDIQSFFDGIHTDFSSSSKGDLQQLRRDILAKMNVGTNEIDTGSDKLEQDREEFEEDDKYPSMEENETESEKLNDEAKDTLADLEETIGEIDEYTQLEEILGKYNEYIEGNGPDPEEVDLSGDASSSAKSSKGLMDDMFSGIGNALVSSRNELYKNEYILMHFESADPTGDFAQDALLENREVEYILYGSLEPGANYSLALSQLFATRFALRFIDAFTQSHVRGAGHPLAVFVAALAHALEEATQDTKDISSGRLAPLINDQITNREALRIDYQDYLRLFLFINPSNDNRLKRIMAVIEKNTDVNLTKRHTYIEGSVSASDRLVFIPQIAQSLNIVGALDGSVDNDRFIFNKKAHFSY
ncbi:DUF5702 domain-containing protein [Gracilibacillus saliphilus]|uniref:DUF5702 domain-containing protein n=1 Tax=Gracilibacillus saliphilus TaxID=543890 RepID=UPI0013D125BA|nr:DUF5702 domain-containing protein [Gracilibacillus saliphilus]